MSEVIAVDALRVEEATGAVERPGRTLRLAPVPSLPRVEPAVVVQRLNVYYGDFHALKDIQLSLPRRAVTALIGPSGCGKSTFLRTLNRMNDHIEGFRIGGRVFLEGVDIYSPGMDVVELRRRVGMVFQRPNPFPLSILDNVTWGLQGSGLNRRQRRERAVESLHKAGLWEEVKDRLHEPAFRLSGGQRQRLCIARALAIRPSVLLMDEPTSALDPRSAAVIEELVVSLKHECTVVLVSHNLHQAARVADYCAFFHMGQLAEHGPAKELMENPQDPRTQAYLSGQMG